MQYYLFLLFVMLATCHTGLSREPITIENSTLIVSFAPQDGTVLSVRAKQSNASYLGDVKQTGWFQIEIPLSHWEGHSAASRDLPALIAEKQGPASIIFQANQLVSKEGRYAISSKLTLRLEGDNLVCRLGVINQSQETIDRVTFPILDVPAASDSKEWLLMPLGSFPLSLAFSENDIRNSHNPFESLDPLDLKAWFYNDPRISIKALNYPMNLPTAWFTFVGDSKGIGFDVRDREIQYQRLMLERRLYRDQVSRAKNRRDYELSWNSYPLVRPGASWESPEVYLKFDSGDWHAIAKQHRDWLRTWIGRPEVAKELQTSIGWISRGISSFDQIPQMAKQGVDVGAPYFIIYGWSQIGPGGMSYGNFPRQGAGGVEQLKHNLQEARALGAYPMAWFNGTLSVETNLEHQLMGKQWTALDRWGGELLGGRWSFFEPFQIAVTPNNDVWIEFDPSTGVKEFLLDTIRRLIEDYKFTGFEMDQGHKNFLSYRKHSGESRPEVAFSKGYSDFFARAQTIVKQANPNGIIVGENLSELMNQYVDSTWIYEGGGLDIPEFSRLRYSWPWLTIPTTAVVTDPGHANQAFMMNAPLDIFDDLAQYPDYSKHLKALHALKKSTAQYLYEGEFSDGESFAIVPATQKGVLAKSYREPTGKFLAVVVVNTGATSIELSLRPALEFASKPARHYSLAGLVKVIKASSSIQMGLGPYDVQLLVFDSEQ